jgi:hypothetical protein
VHGAASAGLLSSGAAIQVQWSSVFCLRRSCAESVFQDQCSHETISERALTATLVVDEVRLAANRGYHVLKIHEFYEYELTHYEPKTGERGHCPIYQHF